MSQIVFEIPIDALRRPNVARALADLTLALYGHSIVPEQFLDEAKTDTTPVVDDDLSDIDAGRYFASLGAIEGDGPELLTCVKAIRAAGAGGLSYDDVRAFFPGIPTSGPEAKRFGFLLGYSGRWCKTKFGFESPYLREGDQYYWDPKRSRKQGKVAA